MEFIRYHLTERPLVLAAIVGACLWWLSGRINLQRSTGGRSAVAAAVLATAVYAGLAIAYAFVATYADHAEPTIPATAWHFWRGGTMYHDAASGPRYALIYGPLLYLTQAWTLAAAGPGLHVSKLPGVTCALVAAILVFVAVRRERGTRAAVLAVGAFTVVALAFRNAMWWTRAEPELTVCAAAALIAARIGTPAAGVALGVVTGLSVLLKFTGPLYVLPAWAMLAGAGRWRAVLVASASAALAVVLPYLHPRISLRDQLYWFTLAADNGIRASSLRVNLGWAIFLVLPLLVSPSAYRGLSRPERWRTIALGIGLLGVAIAAAKPGGGPYHFVPMLPAIVVSVAACAPAWIARRVRIAACAVAISAALIALSQQRYVWRPLIAAERQHVERDVTAFLDAHRGQSVAIGYGGAYRPTFLRPLPVFAGAPYLLDAAALMELDLGGHPVPAATIGMMRRCAVDYWLIPKGGSPFHLPSAYTNRDVLPEAFRDAFLASYRKIDATRHFDIWQCP